MSSGSRPSPRVVGFATLVKCSRHTKAMPRPRPRPSRRICSADADHEHDVDIAVDFEQQAALFFGRARERDDIGAVEHGAQIFAIGTHGIAHDFLEVRAGGLYDVVVPVRLQQRAMRSRSTGGMRRPGPCFAVPRKNRVAD